MKTEEQKLRDRESTRRYRERNPEKSKASTRDSMRRARQDGMGGKIYFLRVSSGPIKIGFTTKKPTGRMAELQAGNHETMTLLTWFPGSKEREQELHKQFRHLLIRSEWFHPGQDLLDFLQSMTH